MSYESDKILKEQIAELSDWSEYTGSIHIHPKSYLVSEDTIKLDDTPNIEFNTYEPGLLKLGHLYQHPSAKNIPINIRSHQPKCTSPITSFVYPVSPRNDIAHNMFMAFNNKRHFFEPIKRSYSSSYDDACVLSYHEGLTEIFAGRFYWENPLGSIPYGMKSSDLTTSVNIIVTDSEIHTSSPISWLPLNEKLIPICVQSSNLLVRHDIASTLVDLIRPFILGVQDLTVDYKYEVYFKKIILKGSTYVCYDPFTSDDTYLDTDKYHVRYISKFVNAANSFRVMANLETTDINTKSILLHNQNITEILHNIAALNSTTLLYNPFSRFLSIEINTMLLDIKKIIELPPLKSVTSHVYYSECSNIVHRCHQNALYDNISSSDAHYDDQDTYQIIQETFLAIYVFCMISMMAMLFYGFKYGQYKSNPIVSVEKSIKKLASRLRSLCGKKKTTNKRYQIRRRFR